MGRDLFCTIDISGWSSDYGGGLFYGCGLVAMAPCIWCGYSSTSARHSCLLLRYAASEIRHIYREANSVINRIASFIMQHSGGCFMNDLSLLPMSFRDIIFSDLLGCIHTHILLSALSKKIAQFFEYVKYLWLCSHLSRNYLSIFLESKFLG